jgi:hypothetical protein
LTLALASSVALAALLASPSAVFAEGVCPNEAFRVGPAAGLPDCRAYEMVTPVYKGSGDVTTESAGVYEEAAVSQDGQSLTIWSTAGFAGASGNTAGTGSPYLLGRGGSGWVSTSMELAESQFLSPAPVELGPFWFGGSVDGRTEVLMARGVTRPSNTLDIYQSRSDGSVLDLASVLPASAPSMPVEALKNLAEIGESGVSADASHVFFHTNDLHWPFDATELGWQSLYEYAGTGNATPMLVGVNNKGELISQCGTALGGLETMRRNSAGNYTRMNHNAISADGRIVFFTALKPSGTEGVCSSPSPPVNEVYARVDNGLADARTVAISEPTNEDCEQCDTEPGVLANAMFEGASEDGSKVFFTTTQPLLGGDGSENIYEYDFDAPPGQSKIIRVSGGDSTVSNPTAGVVGEPVQVSEDGSHVYFAATGVLTTMSNSQGESAQQGAANLYVFERDAHYPAGRIAFIGTLSSTDTQLWQREINLAAAGTVLPGGADTTPDGRFLVFASAADLTPDDTSSVAQIFEYDSQTGSLVRVSVGQGGFNENGNTSEFPAQVPSPDFAFKGRSGVADPRNYWSHMAVSSDGSYVFFSSHNALTPNAPLEHSHENELGEHVYDTGPTVYEYHEGNVYLIAKPGHTGSFVPAQLIGTDTSGADVFIGTTEQLVGQDTDTNGDIYDARIGGGFPVSPSRPECSGDACQGALSAAPVLLSPGSEFQAGGNPPLAGTQSRSVVKKKAKPSKKKKAKHGKKSRHGKKAKRAGKVQTRSKGGGK